MGTGLRDLVAKLRLDTTGFTKGMRGVSQTLKVVGGAMTAASAGVAAAIKGQLDAADQLGESAQKFGVTTEALSKLRHVAEMSGVEFATLGTGLRKLTQNMAAAANGNAKAEAIFKGLGVSVTNADGSLRSVDAVLTDVSEVISKMPDGATKTALSMDLFGKSGADMVPLLNQGRAAIERLSAEAESMGLVISTDTAEAAGTFNDNLDNIRKTLGGLVVQLAASLAPTLVAVSGAVAEAVKAFQNLSPETQALAAKIAVVAMAIGPLLLGLGLVIMPLQAVAATMKAIALAALANPFVLIGLAAAAAGAAIYLYWEPIKAFFAQTWDAIKSSAQAAWDGVKQLAVDAVQATLGAWNGIREVFALVLMNVKDAFVDGWEAIKAEVSTWPGRFVEFGGQIVEGLKQGILEKWDSMIAGLQGKWQELKDSFADALGIRSPSRVFRGFGQNISEGLALGIGDKAPMVDQAMTGVGDALSGSGASLADRMQDFKSAAQSAFVSFVTRAQTARQALSQLAASMAQTFAQKAFSGLWGALFPGFANGGVFSGGRVQAFAKGGVVAGATAFAMQGGMGVMGEAGPEAIMPLSRGADGKLGVRAAGAAAQGLTVTVTMDPSTATLGAFVQDTAGRVVARAVPVAVQQSVKAVMDLNRETRVFG